jgi:N-acyl-D-amino-acid deacylase
MFDRSYFSLVYRRMASMTLVAVLMLICAPALGQQYDLLIRGGMVCDGSLAPCAISDVAISGERIAAIGKLGDAGANTVIDAGGLVVAPGFINMLSWGVETLIIDGRGEGDIRQGVTLEVFGEGKSMGPLNRAMKVELNRRKEYDYEIRWSSLGEYLEYLESRGVSPNVASFVGATTVRIHELGYADRKPSLEELAAMQALVREAMEEGALGVGSSLIYAPAFYAGTDELVALVQAAAEYEGMYISHIRSEGNRLLQAVDELIEIAERSGAPAEIYHLKMGGRENWNKIDAVISRIEAARARGTRISADMYTYTAGSTGLDAAMPPWAQEGGYEEWARRLQDPVIRARLEQEMTTPGEDWENLMLAAGADKTLLVGFRNEQLREQYTGMTLAEVASLRGTSAAETAMDLVVEDGSRVQVVYFLMSEDNVRRIVTLPWVSFGSDAEAMATEGVFTKRSTHPRAYGNFARVLGKYVREEKALSLSQAIHKLTGLPASNLGIRERGSIRPGYYADIAIFDAGKIRDHATYAKPHQYATGMVHVFVNGSQVLENGEHTGALPGRVVRGPGWRGWQSPENRAGGINALP